MKIIIIKEKRNAVGIGLTVVDNKAYVSGSYERTISEKNNVTAEAIVHTIDMKNIDGATILIKKKF